MPEQSKLPGPPQAIGLATRASSSRSTFCASRRNAPSPTGVADLKNASGFRCCATMPMTWRAHVVAVDGLDVQPIEQRVRRRHPGLLVIDRSDPPVDERGRRRLAEVVADARRASPRPAAARSRSSMRVRAWSITSSVWTQTSPSGCHSGSCGQPTSACSSGNSRAMMPSSSARREADRRPLREQQQLLDLAPDALGRQIVERNAATELASSRHPSRARIAPRTARRAARAGCRRRTSAGSTTRRTRRSSRSPRPSNGIDVFARVSGSQGWR